MITITEGIDIIKTSTSKLATNPFLR